MNVQEIVASLDAVQTDVSYFETENTSAVWASLVGAVIRLAYAEAHSNSEPDAVMARAAEAVKALRAIALMGVA